VTLARLGLLAAALVTVLGGLLATPDPPPLGRFALAVVVAVASYALMHRFRSGSEVVGYLWCEVALLVGLFLLPPGWVPLVLAVGYALGRAARVLLKQTDLRALPESAAREAVAGGTAALLCLLIANPYRAELTPALMAGLVLATVGYAAVNETIGRTFFWLRTRTLPRVPRHDVVIHLRNTVLGLTAVAVAQVSVDWLLVLPAVLWLLNRGYAFPVRVTERRRMWSALTAATRSLNRQDEESVAAAGLRGVQEVFAVGRAELELGSGNGAWRGWAADSTGEIHPMTELPEEDAGTATPLLVGDREIGRLRVHFPPFAGPGTGELAALRAYADALSAALQGTATHQQLHQLLDRSVRETQHDPLTGLLNRAALLALGDTAIQQAPHAQPVALMLIDVDHFREINETLSHAAGDEVLRVAARRLRDAAGPGELVGRLGGDEFAILTTDSADVGRRARELVSRLAEEADINGVLVSVESSVGVVVAPASSGGGGGRAEEGIDVAELLRRADAALRQAKRGGGTVGWYEPERDAGGPERPALLAELRRALDRKDELVLAMQPVVDLTTGAPAGVEALVRWRHPQRGLLPPAEFVRAVENSDLLGAFTEYVIDRALAAAARWGRHGPAVPVAVNLSARSLLDPRLPEAVGALLRRHKLPGRRLVLEITESVVSSDLPGLEGALRGLRALGVRLAVDDFGTGHASLTMLTRLPLDEVKVDGVFVTRLETSVEAAAIVRATVELGRELGLQVVAEGVETADQLRALTRLGCTTGQGFHLAPPTSVHRIGQILRSLGNPSLGNGQLRAS
jgi:diguanylate cyclase (GGDEF)-like protein